MASLLDDHPGKTLRSTWLRVLARRRELPSGSTTLAAASPSEPCQHLQQKLARARVAELINPASSGASVRAFRQQDN